MVNMLLRIWIITKRTFLGFTGDNCTQQAAAITYYILFSLAPLAIVVVAVLGIFLNGEEVRDRVVDWVLEVIPLSSIEGRASVTEIVEEIQNVNATFAVIGLVVALWSSLAVFAAIRRALNNVWGMEEHRPYAQAKVVDLMQVGVVCLVLVASIVLTGLVRTAREVSADYLGPIAGGNVFWEIPSAIAAGLVTLAAFCVLYRIVPAVHPGWRAVVPGAILATVLFELLKNSFAIYVANFNSYSVVYGSLAGILLFLFYMFLASNILLIGAEFVKTMQRYQAGAYDLEINPPVPLPPVTTRMLRSLRGLFVRD
jgi:membrane protein